MEPVSRDPHRDRLRDAAADQVPRRGAPEVVEDPGLGNVGRGPRTSVLSLPHVAARSNEGAEPGPDFLPMQTHHGAGPIDARMSAVKRMER